jgi:hypothetical protein
MLRFFFQKEMRSFLFGYAEGELFVGRLLRGGTFLSHLTLLVLDDDLEFEWRWATIWKHLVMPSRPLQIVGWRGYDKIGFILICWKFLDFGRVRDVGL